MKNENKVVYDNLNARFVISNTPRDPVTLI
jgi:hypothetical protein